MSHEDLRIGRHYGIASVDSATWGVDDKEQSLIRMLVPGPVTPVAPHNLVIVKRSESENFGRTLPTHVSMALWPLCPLNLRVKGGRTPDASYVALETRVNPSFFGIMHISSFVLVGTLSS